MLRRAKCRFFPKNASPLIPKIGMGKNADELNGSVGGDILSYPLHRIGRLEPNIATAILAAWATFQTRSALGYDFAQTKSDTSASGEQTVKTTPEKVAETSPN